MSIEFVAEEIDDSCSIYELNDSRCRFPLAEIHERPPFRYCGKPPIKGSPYCQHHHDKAITTNPFRLRGSIVPFRR